MNETVSQSLTRDHLSIAELQTMFQDLKGSLHDKTKSLELKLRQIEGDSVNGDEDDHLPKPHYHGSNHGSPKKQHQMKFKSPDESNKVKEAPVKSLKDMFKAISGQNKVLSDQVEKLQAKVESQSLDLFGRVKKELASNY